MATYSQLSLAKKRLIGYLQSTVTIQKAVKMATYSQKRNLFILYEYSAVFTEFYLSGTRLKQGGRVGGVGGGESVDVNQELKLFEN